MIGMRTRAPKSSEGKMVNGRETLRLRSKGAATVQEVVSEASSRDPSSGFEYGLDPDAEETFLNERAPTVDKTLLCLEHASMIDYRK